LFPRCFECVAANVAIFAKTFAFANVENTKVISHYFFAFDIRVAPQNLAKMRRLRSFAPVRNDSQVLGLDDPDDEEEVMCERYLFFLESAFQWYEVIVVVATHLVRDDTTVSLLE
jgi:hypothetical protein